MELKLAPMDGDIWMKLKGAYGNVRDIVKLLMGAPEDIPVQKRVRSKDHEKTDLRIVFDNLIAHLCYQMDFYPATYLVMPYIVKFFEKEEFENDFEWQCTILAGAGRCLITDTVFNARKCVDDEQILAAYQLSIQILREHAEVFLKKYADEIEQLEKTSRLALFTALLALFGNHDEAMMLLLTNWEECYLLCDACRYSEGDIGITELVQRKDIERAESVIGRWDGENDADTYVWFSNVLHQCHAAYEEERLSCFYGTYTCPKCKKTGRVFDFMKNYFME